MALTVTVGEEVIDHRVETRSVRADKAALGGKTLAEEGDERFGRWAEDAESKEPLWLWNWTDVEDLIGVVTLPMSAVDDKTGQAILEATFSMEINVGNPRAREIVKAKAGEFKAALLERAQDRARVIAVIGGLKADLSVAGIGEGMVL